MGTAKAVPFFCKNSVRFIKAPQGDPVRPPEKSITEDSFTKSGAFY